jgi:hypothetical protein
MGYICCYHARILKVYNSLSSDVQYSVTMKPLGTIRYSYVMRIWRLYLSYLSLLSLSRVRVYKANALRCISTIWSNLVVLLTSNTPRIAVTLLLHFVIVITNKRKTAAVTNKLSIPSEIRYKIANRTDEKDVSCICVGALLRNFLFPYVMSCIDNNLDIIFVFSIRQKNHLK